MNKQIPKIVFSVGTSARSIEEFINLLRFYGINTLVDVRRFPTSRFEHFKKETLQKLVLIELKALEWAGKQEEERKDFYLYLDEFQAFSTMSIAHMLSEARKYRLNLILAHQYLDQLTEEARSAVFGNVGTIISFRVGAEDALYLSNEFC